jgi:hypothetical protein
MLALAKNRRVAAKNSSMVEPRSLIRVVCNLWLIQAFLEIIDSSFPKGGNFLATRHAIEKAASRVGHLDHRVRRLLNELPHLFRVGNLPRHGGAAKNIDGIDIWLTGTLR